MKLLGKERLRAFKQKHGDVCAPCEAWEQEVANANWKRPQDIKNRFPSASFLGDNCVIFNLKGTKYRIGVIIYYPTESVLVEWALTHAEYTKKFG
ncbi:MAG: type II toxin-antitoxin system HigB family toxin [Candidatus Moranbacteria bacterium]|jgi:mRNA interferase HigB|nr:type II toxin-antitoxin system HigB family toxin [Candidatus Moranbacteria bacterium]